MPQTFLPRPSLLLPVSQSQERLELSVTRAEGCGFGRVLETASKVFGWMEGNFFLCFCNIPFTKQRELLCCSDTCLERADEGTGDPAVQEHGGLKGSQHTFLFYLCVEER